MTFLSTSCLKDLDVVPIDPNILTSATVYQTPEGYRQVLAKLYAGLAVSGQDGPTGMPDIAGIDEGFGQYLRALWYHQVLTTDEAVIGWDDQTIKDFVYHRWTSSDVFVTAMYYRIFYQITLANEFIRESTPEKLDQRNIPAEARERIAGYRAEARFLRALSYWHALDLFGSVPFVTENDLVGAFLPRQISREDLFDYIEQELLDILPTLPDPLTNDYPRADKAAAWMLLAKLYLNAEVYIGEPRFTEVITYTNLIIDAGFALEPNYIHLFNADNDPISHPTMREVIFAIAYDGLRTQTFGGTNFIIHASIGGQMVAAHQGSSGGWGGLRTTKNLVNLFDVGDTRARFFTTGQTLEIVNLGDFSNGYAVVKFTNIRRDGTPGQNLSQVDTDFPLFRLADVYLMYAEAVLRGGSGGSMATAIEYVNRIRERAFGDASGNVASIDLDFIIDERGRELYWEGHRRTDLIRFGRFTGGTYLWPWKGFAEQGAATDPKYNLFPIPFADLTANPNLTPTPGF